MNANQNQSETEVLQAITSMPENDRNVAERLHKIITSTAPNLVPRTWYNMPAYTIRTKGSGDKILCFLRSRQKFGERFMTFGFNDVAKLDEGNMWPISYALTKLTDAEEKKIIEIIKKAIN